MANIDNAADAIEIARGVIEKLQRSLLIEEVKRRNSDWVVLLGGVTDQYELVINSYDGKVRELRKVSK